MFIGSSLKKEVYMNIFEMAEKRLQETKDDYSVKDIINCAVKIRKWLDRQEYMRNYYLQKKK